jgi:hypothetical protein
MQRNDQQARPMHDDTTDDLGTDLLRGVEPIAEFLDETPRRVSYLIERSLIPYAKEGRSIISRKSWLRRHYSRPSNVDEMTPGVAIPAPLNSAATDLLMRYQNMGAEVKRQGSNVLSSDLLFEIAELLRLTDEILN